MLDLEQLMDSPNIHLSNPLIITWKLWSSVAMIRENTDKK